VTPLPTKPNLVTRMLEAVGLKKRHELYKGSGVNRLTLDRILSRMAMVEEVRRSIRKLRDAARELDRNDGYAKQFLRSLALNVVGPTGMRLQATVRSGPDLDTDTNRKIEESWKLWARRTVTVGTPMFLVELEHLLIKTMAREGECFCRLYPGYEGNDHRLVLQPIDPDLVDENLNRARSSTENEIRMGIEIDATGTPVAYWVWNEHPDTASPTPKFRYPVPAAQMIHLYLVERAGQPRGLTWFTGALLPGIMLEGYEDGVVTTCRVAANQSAFWTKKEESIGDGLDDTKNATKPIYFDAEPGSIGFGPDGYELHQFNPEQPTEQYAAFRKGVLRRVAAALGISYNHLGQDLEGVNMSSLRHGLQGEREIWEYLQQVWALKFRVRLYEAWLNTSLLSGALILGSRDWRRYASCNFLPRGWGYVSPLEDVQTSEKEIELGLNSRRRIMAKRQADQDEIFRELAEENALAEKYGLSITPQKSTPAATPTDSEEDEEGDEPRSTNGNGSRPDRRDRVGRPGVAPRR
jgi:lambda family phage portal protein